MVPPVSPEHSLFPLKRRRVLIGAGLLVLLLVVIALAYPHSSGADVVQLVNAIPNGGGYHANDMGVPAPISHKGVLILPASKQHGTHCCGIVFYVAMKVAEQRGLLKDKEPFQVKRFQRECFGATPQSREKEVALAMENFQIGRQIPARDAQPGDFVCFQRSRSKTAHSVIFLEWVRRDGVIIGVKYRSSQPSTDGLGNRTEYFTTSGLTEAQLDPERFYVARLNG
jgi:hypothetical protein